jgi:hypothetical protein
MYSLHLDNMVSLCYFLLQQRIARPFQPGLVRLRLGCMTFVHRL